MSNVYYDPEKFGLETVGEVEFSDGCYVFDTSVVWRDIGTGRYLVADDAGCSCPVPFESVGVSDLTKIGKLQDLIDYFDQRKTDSYYYDPDDEYGEKPRIDGEIGELILKVKADLS